MSGKTVCPRCSSTFECLPDRVSDCECSKIDLSGEEYRFISDQYSGCLCNRCLTDIKNELFRTGHPVPVFTVKKIVTVLMLLIGVKYFSQPYPPGVGVQGTTAMHKDSSAFVSWATSCKVVRGWQDISDQNLGKTTAGDSTMAQGKANGSVVSLGDGGVATCIFSPPIGDGPGADLAVFENAVTDGFLELAFVEASSDGVNFFRFPAHSLTDTTTQTSSFGSTDPTKINNLAGKYRAGYGTPFDLQELASSSGLNTQSVTHIRVLDVVGSMNISFATRDKFGNKVNDPWPTAFPTGGFDLDAIGVIHQAGPASVKEHAGPSEIVLFPNPVKVGEQIHFRGPGLTTGELYDSKGTMVRSGDHNGIETIGLPPGFFFIKFSNDRDFQYRKIVIE
jgi:hypothetical protein